MRYGTIYLAINKINDKKYVGITRGKLSDRVKSHFKSAKYSCKTYFHRALNKYGKENFVFIELCSGLYSYENLCSLEDHFIRHYNSIETGYNLKHAEFTKDWVEEQRNIMLKDWQTNPEREKVRENLRRIAKTPENYKARYDGLDEYRKTEEGKEEMKKHSKNLWETGVLSKEDHLARLEKRWSDPKEHERMSKIGKESNKDKETPILGVHKVSGEIIRYNCVQDALRDGFSSSCITESLKQRVVTGQNYIWFYFDGQNHSVYKKLAEQRMGGSLKSYFQKPFIAQKEDQIIEFNAIEEVKSIELKPKEVARALREGNRKVRGWSFKFK